ncbi:MAG TPA: glutaredoxin family protein [Candidatus Paceibacterota bacterium]
MAETPKVTIYTTPTCVYCKMAKQYFNAHNVAYEEKNVAVDRAAAEAMVKKTGQMGVPVIEVGDQTVIGFDEASLAQLLNIK